MYVCVLWFLVTNKMSLAVVVLVLVSDRLSQPAQLAFSAHYNIDILLMTIIIAF